SEGGRGSDPTAHFVRETWDEWCFQWFAQARRVSRGAIVFFCPTTKLAQSIQQIAHEYGSAWRLLVWVKPDGRPRFGGQLSYAFEPIIAAGHLQPVGGPDWFLSSAPRLNRDAEAVGHPHQKPEDVIAWLVTLASPPGGTVLDPFAGSGTVREVATALGRNAVLIELNPAYVALAEARTAQLGLFA